MDSVNGIERAHPSPFFYTRLMARIGNRESSAWERVSRLITRPSIAAISLSLVLILNVFVVVNQVSANDAPDNSETALAEEYSSANAYYAIENVQP